MIDHITLRRAAERVLQALDESLYMNDYCGLEVSKHKQPDVTNAIEALRAALAEPAQEPCSFPACQTEIGCCGVCACLVSPSTPKKFDTVPMYGHCPECLAPGVERELRINGRDRCANGHWYRSSHACYDTAPTAINAVDEENKDD